MKILIIENDFERKQKAWQLLCMASSNGLDMDFTHGETDEEEFSAISLNIEAIKSVRQLEAFLKFWIEHEEPTEEEE